MLTGLLIFATLIMKLFPETPLARSLHRHLIEWPLARLAAMERRHLIFVLILVGMALCASELVAMLGSADLAAGFAWDLSIYVDTLVAAWTLSAVARGRMAWRALLVRAVRRPRRPRARSRHAGPFRPAPGNDDEEGPACAFALAA